MNIDDLLLKFIEILDSEIDLLLRIRYRLTVLGAIADVDQGKFIPTAVGETESACESLRLTELVRGSVTAELIEHFDLDGDASIEQIAKCVPEGWNEILIERRTTLIEVVEQVQQVATRVSKEMGSRAALASEALSFLKTDIGLTYGRSQSRGGLLIEGAI